MASSKSKRSEKTVTQLKSELTEILRNSKSINGPTTKYILKPTFLIEGDLIRREIFGQKNEDKPRKIIVMVGETGTGKSTLINAMINYIMGVRWEHKMWLEVTEIPEDQTESQTKAVTVYDVYAPSSPFVLTVIDTPGFGDTEGFDKDKRVSEALQELFRSEDGIHEIHAVCLVLKGSDVRLHDRQRYILDEVLSLFGKDIEKHILLLFTNKEQQNLSSRMKNFIKESIGKYVTNDEYVSFSFDNCQSEYCDEEDRESYKTSWDNGVENYSKFFNHLNKINPKSLDMTEGVLRTRKQLDASVGNLRERIELAELKKQELEQTKTALVEFENYKKEKNNFEYEVDEPFKVLVSIDASWWHLSKQATRCPKCEENCHYPGCWWAGDISKCSVMKNGECTVCTGVMKDGKRVKCKATDHKKDYNKYKIDTKKVTKTIFDLEDNYKKNVGEKKSLMANLQEDIQQIEAEKIRLVEECYQCFDKLMKDALKSTSISSFIHMDFMIDKVKETGNQERVQKLEELKKRAIEENRGMVERLRAYAQQK